MGTRKPRVCGSVARDESASKPMGSSGIRLPPLPAKIATTIGPVPVRVVKDLRDENKDPIFGRWLPEERIIEVCEMPSLVTRWTTLMHERIHQILEDAGAKPTDPDTEERVCDAVATALVVELMSRPAK